MGKRCNFIFVCLILCAISVTGCQIRPDKSKKAQDNNQVESNNVITDTGQADCITSGESKNTDGNIVQKGAAAGNMDTDINESGEINMGDTNETKDAGNKAAISNPEQLFEHIELAKAYKSIGYNNPLMSQRFGADPFAMVYGDRVYVYMTNDIVEYDAAGRSTENTYGKINSINCISSEDLVNWTDHGPIKVGGYLGAAKWAKNSWAPAAAHKTINGKEKFFLYFADNASSIGVLTSDSPAGPFTDPIGKPLITRQTKNCSDITWLFDPAVFIDDDGRAYLYFGGGVPAGKEEMPNTARVAELSEDMISLKGAPAVIEAPYLFEDSGINKIGDTYYYSYCSSWSGRDKAVGKYKPEIAEIIYMTGNNPMGPWQYRGSILKNPGSFFGSYGNNHHCMVNFKEKWYMFYHSQVLADVMGIKGGYRCTHADEVHINEDGSIQSVNASKFGVKQLSYLNPYKVTEAETIAWMGGISTKYIKEADSTYGTVNMAVTDISSGDWIGLSGVDFGDKEASTFTAKVSSKCAGNVIKICLDKITGECIGYLEVPNTESDDQYTEVTVKVNKVTGVHNLFFVFSGEGFNFDSWNFE